MKINEVINENFKDRLPFLEKLTPLAPKTTPIGKLNLSPNKPSKKKPDAGEVKIVTYIGPNATDWNNPAYLKAVQLHKQGKSEDEIWKETRTVQDAAGDWWQEISDHESTLKRDKPEGFGPGRWNQTQLDKVINDPSLFKQYPHLKDINVVWDEGGQITGRPEVDGWYDDRNTIGLADFPSFNSEPQPDWLKGAIDDLNKEWIGAGGKGGITGPDDGVQREKEILYHEIAHAIDKAEGRRNGSASLANASNISDVTGIDDYKVYSGSQAEILARDTANRLTMDDKWRSENTPRVKGRSSGEKNPGSKKTIVIHKKNVGYGDQPGSSYDVIDNPNYGKPPYGNSGVGS